MAQERIRLNPAPDLVDRLRLTERFACIFTRRGELRWRSPAWTGGKVVPDDHLIGTRWHEFVRTEDLPGLLAWFADERNPDTLFEFRAMAPTTAKMIVVVYAKTPYGEDWLCLGRVLGLEEPEGAGSGERGAGSGEPDLT